LYPAAYTTSPSRDEMAYDDISEESADENEADVASSMELK